MWILGDRDNGFDGAEEGDGEGGGGRRRFRYRLILR